MLPKCLVLFVAVVAVKSATFQARNIPVEIRYERFDHGIDSNLNEKIQLSREDIKENNLRLGIVEEDVVPTNQHNDNFIRNFNEKVQLSPEQLLQSSKHLPVDPEIQEHEFTGNREVLGELRGNPVPETKSDTLSQASFVQRAQDIVLKGLESLRQNFQPKDNERSPSDEDWDKLESNLREYFLEERNKLEARQNAPTQSTNFFQNIANGFQEVTNNFVQQFQGQNQTGTSGDEGQAPQQQGPFQGFVGYFTGGVQNIVSTIQNIGQPASAGNSTVLGDSGTGGNQQPGNFIGNIVNNVQQLFQGQIQANGSQGDTGDGGTQQGFFAGAINQFNQVVSNIIPTSSQKPPGAAGDEGVANPPDPPSQSTGPFQQVVQGFGNIGTAINQFIQGPQQNNPPGSEDENANNPPPNQNFVQSIGQNIGNAIQSIQNQFRPPAIPQIPGAEGSSGGSTNPIVGQVSNIGNQLQQIAGQQAGSNPIQNLIPGSSATPSKQPAEQRLEDEASTILNTTENVEAETKESEKKEEVMTATE